MAYPPRLTMRAAPLTEAALAGHDHALLMLPSDGMDALAARLPHGALIRRRLQECGDGDGPRTVTVDLPNERATRLTVGSIAADATSFERLTLARRMAAAHRRAERIAVAVEGVEGAPAEACVEAMLAAVLAARAELPRFTSRPRREPALRSMAVFGCAPRHRFRRTFAEAQGNALARSLTLLPPNHLTPGSYRRRVAALARELGWQMEFLDQAALRRRGAGAFLAVTQASSDRDAGIVRLVRKGRRPGRVALVGKGICFDTGGVNVKPQRHMRGMHGDMQGSAVALGTLLALTRLDVPFGCEAWLALARNDIGPRGYRPEDVVTAADGTTIEVVHTDAEGRMVLADTLVLASRTRPRLIVDYATLTGACVYALGSAYSGAFTNREALQPLLVAAGRASGERVWPFPMDSDYDKALESRIADVKQCTDDGTADHILAARFLSRFVQHDTPWVHIDLSSGSHKGGLAHVPTEVTGFGVRLTLNLLLDQGAATARL